MSYYYSYYSYYYSKKQTKEEVYYKHIFQTEKIPTQTNLAAADEFRFKEDLKEEVKKYSSLIRDDTFIANCENSFEFWIHKENEYRILSQLALRLCSINSSSTFIKRFFSVCGVIANSRKKNMENELFFLRAYLACNFSVLNNITLKK